MKKRNIVFILSAVIFMVCAAALAMKNTQVEQKAVIGGNVSYTVTVGSVVKSGDPLVEISTLTGTTPAARATVDGTVKQILVKQGDTVKAGQIVAYIEQLE